METTNTIGATAALTNYLIERVSKTRVDLNESQGGAWVPIRSRITRATAAAYGFNLDSPAVDRVFEGL